MAVNNRDHVWPHAVNFAVNEPLPVNCASARILRLALLVEFNDVVFCDEPRRDRACHPVVCGIFYAASTNVAEAVDYALVEQDVIAGHQVRDALVIGIAGFSGGLAGGGGVCCVRQAQKGCIPGGGCCHAE